MIYLNFCFKYFIFLFLNFYFKKTKIIFKICKNIYFNKILGIGDWGLGIGDWGLGQTPNPQSPMILIILISYSIIYFII